MRTGKFVTAVMVSMPLASGLHAASDSPPEKLFKATSDHTGFKVLQREVDSGPQAAKACLNCHAVARVSHCGL